MMREAVRLARGSIAVDVMWSDREVRGDVVAVEDVKGGGELVAALRSLPTT